MKTFILMLSILFFSQTTFANTFPTTTNEDQLIGSSWEKAHSDGGKIYLDFKEPNIVDIYTESNGKLDWAVAYWSLEDIQGQPYLNIQYKLGVEAVQLKLDNQFDHMQLSGHIDYKRSSNAFGTVVKADLVGTWKTKFYDTKTGTTATASTKNRNRLKYGFIFNDNGTFTKVQQEFKSVEKENGVWTLSENGEFIKLHYTKKNNAENVYKTEVFRIEDFKTTNMRVHTQQVQAGEPYITTKLDLSKS